MTTTPSSPNDPASDPDVAEPEAPTETETDPDGLPEPDEDA